MAHSIVGSWHDEFISWYESLHTNNVLFMFKGDFSQDLINSIVKLTDNMSEFKLEETIVKQRLTGAIVECLQNICRHGESNSVNKFAKPGIILLRRQENSYVLNIGNILPIEKVKDMKDYIGKVSSLDKQGLRDLHKEVLQSTELYGKYGADIGLINVAKNSEKMFGSCFHGINDNYSFFSLEVYV